MDRVLDAGAEALESLGAQLRAGAEGLRREDQQQQQAQPEAEAEARRTEGHQVRGARGGGVFNLDPRVPSVFCGPPPGASSH